MGLVVFGLKSAHPHEAAGAPRTATSAFAGRRSLWATHATAAFKISDRERKFRPRTIRAWPGKRWPSPSTLRGSAPRHEVDELVVVRHGTDVSVRSGEERDQDCVRLVGVLELIDHDPFPALAVVHQAVRMLG